MNYKREGIKESKGFTLVEILVVLAILAVLSVVVIPTMSGIIEDAKGRKYIPEARIVAEAVQIYLIEKGTNRRLTMKEEMNLIMSPVTDKKNPLYAKLEGSCTSGGTIIEFTEGVSNQIIGIKYEVKGYEIDINFGGMATVK